MSKLKNILAENMRRFGTKNLNEDDNSYKANQEYSRLNKIANAVITKLRANSTYDIDVEEDDFIATDSIIKTNKILNRNRYGILPPNIVYLFTSMDVKILKGEYSVDS
jgi:hypothetical protein